MKNQLMSTSGGYEFHSEPRPASLERKTSKKKKKYRDTLSQAISSDSRVSLRALVGNKVKSIFDFKLPAERIGALDLTTHLIEEVRSGRNVQTHDCFL